MVYFLWSIKDNITVFPKESLCWNSSICLLSSLGTSSSASEIWLLEFSIFEINPSVCPVLIIIEFSFFLTCGYSISHKITRTLMYYLRHVFSLLILWFKDKPVASLNFVIIHFLDCRITINLSGVFKFSQFIADKMVNFERYSFSVLKHNLPLPH